MARKKDRRHFTHCQNEGCNNEIIGRRPIACYCVECARNIDDIWRKNNPKKVKEQRIRLEKNYKRYKKHRRESYRRSIDRKKELKEEIIFNLERLKEYKLIEKVKEL